MCFLGVIWGIRWLEGHGWLDERMGAGQGDGKVGDVIVQGCKVRGISKAG